MNALDPALIAQLLKEEAEQPTRSGGGRGRKADPTLQRDLLTWNKLNHHICAKHCEHRTDGDNPTIKRNEAGEVVTIGWSCWNPECMDHTRQKDEDDENFDRGTQIVSEVHGVYMCRYCYLGEWRLGEE